MDSATPQLRSYALGSLFGRDELNSSKSKASALRETMLPDEIDSSIHFEPRRGLGQSVASPSAVGVNLKTKHWEESTTGPVTSPEAGARIESELPIRESRIDGVENSLANLGISKKIEAALDKLASYSAAEEESRGWVLDPIQWTCDAEVEIPLNIREEIANYKRSGESTIRLQRRVSGAFRVLAYILKNRLLLWFFDCNKQLSVEFNEVIQDVGSHLLLTRVHKATHSTWSNRHSSMCHGGKSPDQTGVQNSHSH